ncbi:MAG: NAD(P)/FAD-dependent oxidoreductase [Defluviitaleaceae bacterium]|nr:NAD(P)/FAD-dependent oxidoreductase [Defluviitaleaceae bacterium]
MRVTVVGGGPAGMMAAITAAGRGHAVTLMEKNNRLGRKLAMTGGGRCNLTYAADPEVLIRHIVGNPTFLYSAFYTFGSEALMDFFESRGVPLKVEAGRVFPKSERAWDIVEVLEEALAELNVNVLLSHTVTDIRQVLDEADGVILTTGGCTYPATGSTGAGYQWARELGHTVTDLRPALVPLLTKEAGIADLAGLSLQDVKLTFGAQFSEVGELLFTHKGLSGPLVLEASRYAAEGTEMVASIDLMPNLDASQVDKLLLEAFEDHPNKTVGNIIDKMLPRRLIPLLTKSPEIKANSFTKQERADLINTIKGLPFTITETAGFKEAMITAGGVDVREINPSTMESKIVPGLYFAGEVLDVDGVTGGFNLQIAFSTGYLAGSSV